MHTQSEVTEPMNMIDIEALAREAAEPKNMGSPAWQFVNVEVLAALVAEQCAQITDYNWAGHKDSAERIRAAFPMPKG